MDEFQIEMQKLESIYGAGKVPQYELDNLNAKHKVTLDLSPGSKLREESDAYYDTLISPEKFGKATAGVNQLEQKEIEAFGEYNVRTDPRDYEGMTEQRAANQSSGEQIGHALAKFVPNVALGFVEQTADALDLPGYFNQEDEVGNVISDWARGVKQDINEALPIYTPKNSSFLPGSNFDSGALINMLSSVAESGASFALTGSALNKGLQALKAVSKGRGIVGVLGEAANLANAGSAEAGVFDSTANFLNSIKNKTGFGSQELAIAFATNQAESVGIAADTYNNTLANLKGLGYRDDYAKEIAGSAAQQAMTQNRANFILNLTGLYLISPFFAIKFPVTSSNTSAS